ncbi:PREDICTED: probable purine permease 11 [Nelumbo nucifera]|uniref:Probable purine permease n=1 Tax=Nelumbo nucifera TaxID=4432 RepID=A0A1U7ZHK4_NELNU|nr:PREDICTED: probable purine permease 11 [Nelumbo nucifera]
MERAQELQLHIRVQETNKTNSQKDDTINNHPLLSRLKHYNRWVRVIFYTLLLLSGQPAATLLGRLYYDKGGKSKWMATIVQSAGFPILILPLCLFQSSPANSIIKTTKASSTPTIGFIYASLGILVAGDNMLYSYGLLYLPVSTYSLICATQLAFNALFSFFLNSQKFTPFILNSLVLLTISSTLLVLQPDSTENTGISKGKHAIGVLFTVGASAVFSLYLSLTQLSYQKVLKKETFSVVLEMIFYQSLVATCASTIGLFASGDWKGLKSEMEEYGLGKLSYIMTLVWTAVGWQISSIGTVGLIFDVSSLFSNCVSTLCLPIVPILAMVFFHDKMDGIKVVALLLAIWGFVSYVYQHYIDDSKSKGRQTEANEVSNTTLTATETN